MGNATERARTLRRLIRVAPLAALVVAVNALGDPARVVSRGAYERAVADILLSGRHAAGVSNYDERLVQRLYAEGLQAAPDVLVLGSSRVMPLRAGDFAPRSFYNASVSSATLHDVLALHELFASRGGGLSLLVVGIDPWMLQPNEKMVGWHTLAAEYERACLKAGLPECDQAPLLAGSRRLLNALVSPSYFQASSAAFWRRFAGGGAVAQPLTAVSDDGAAPQQAVRRADGSLRYAQAFGQDQEQVRAAARDYGRDFERGRIVFLPPSARPQPRFLQLLEAFLRMTRSAGTEVWLVLAPYHPDAWSALSADGSMIVQAEDAVRGLGAALRLRVLGSFDPRRAGCPEAAEYNDPVHARESCLERLIAPPPPPSVLTGYFSSLFRSMSIHRANRML